MKRSFYDRREARRQRRRRREAREAQVRKEQSPLHEAMARIHEAAEEQVHADLCGTLREAREQGDPDGLKHAIALLQDKTLPERKEKRDTYWRCGGCDVITTPGPLTVHQTATGHTGRTPL